MDATIDGDRLFSDLVDAARRRDREWRGQLAGVPACDLAGALCVAKLLQVLGSSNALTEDQTHAFMLAFRNTLWPAMVNYWKSEFA